FSGFGLFFSLRHGGFRPDRRSLDYSYRRRYAGPFFVAGDLLGFRSQKSKPALGMDGLIGEIGEVRGKLTPSGKIFVHGEHWNARADSEIDVGEKVEVVGYEGMSLKVRRSSERSSKDA